VLDPGATPLLARRNAASADLAERMFALFTLGGREAVFATYLMGRSVWERA